MSYLRWSSLRQDGDGAPSYLRWSSLAGFQLLPASNIFYRGILVTCNISSIGIPEVVFFLLFLIREGGIFLLNFFKCSYEYGEPDTKFLCKIMSFCLVAFIYLYLEMSMKLVVRQFSFL